MNASYLSFFFVKKKNESKGKNNWNLSYCKEAYDKTDYIDFDKKNLNVKHLIFFFSKDSSKSLSSEINTWHKSILFLFSKHNSTLV